MSDLTMLIAAAISAFQAIDAKYYKADMNTRATLADDRNKAANAVLKLRDKQIELDTTINAADIAEMNKLAADVKDGADLQGDITKLMGILAKYVPV
ncbi:hypothetical protein [Thalassospira sp. TSL5-1]|uniref:hypothetical protein n=1 Tax=Thalassospira sp. TSL5-1 TaxID=1544451 RepID=UPI00093898FC|nr:hypothetical protein [Thalassospira sp. TSL5-1]OKH87791.1 hypothetical protein LF95_13755 [Thalassospira sp. TSL5-1]